MFRKEPNFPSKISKPVGAHICAPLIPILIAATKGHGTPCPYDGFGYLRPSSMNLPGMLCKAGDIFSLKNGTFLYTIRL